jgi:hypothetical protein
MPAPSKVAKQSKPSQVASLRSGHPDTPPDSPTQTFSINVIISDHVQQLLDILKQATKEKSRSSEISPSAGPYVERNTQPAEAKVLASKLEFKIVDEVYVAFSIVTAFLIFCFAVGILVFPDIRSWSQHRQKKWQILTDIYSLFVLESVN